MTLWRSVARAHAERAFTGDGAARFPGRYNAPGVRAVYLADCPAGCALELVQSYVAPETIATHLLFEVDVAVALVDLRTPQMLRRYGVTLAALTAPADYDAARRVGTRLLAEKHAGAMVPAATVNQAFNVVIFPDVWDQFVIREAVPLALSPRLIERIGT